MSTSVIGKVAQTLGSCELLIVEKMRAKKLFDERRKAEQEATAAPAAAAPAPAAASHRQRPSEQQARAAVQRPRREVANYQ